MKIFYLKKEKFLKTIERDTLEKVSDKRVYGSEQKYLEHLCGIYLTKFVAQKFYNISDTTIVYDGGKPRFLNNDLFFSISHSKEIVLVAFSDKNIGVDVEFMAKRDTEIYKKLFLRYSVPCENPTTVDFYTFWTVHEAKIKLGTHPKSIITQVLEDNYMLSCVVDEENINKIETIKEIELWT